MSSIALHRAKKHLQHWLKQVSRSPVLVAKPAWQQHLQFYLHKLDQGVLHIAAFGLVGRGKSSLLNALVGKAIFNVGVEHGVTRSLQKATWELGINSPIQTIQVVDTPGLDEVEGAARSRLARRLVRRADVILFVVSGDMNRLEYDALVELAKAGKPLLVVINKADQYPDFDQGEILSHIRDRRLRDLLLPENIVMVAAAPRAYTPVWESDGSLSTTITVGTPQIDALQERLVELIRQQGTDLVVNNALYCAAQIREQWVERQRQYQAPKFEASLAALVALKAGLWAFSPWYGLAIAIGLGLDLGFGVRVAGLYREPGNRQVWLGSLANSTIANLLPLLLLEALHPPGFGVINLVAAAGTSLATYRFATQCRDTLLRSIVQQAPDRAE